MSPKPEVTWPEVAPPMLASDLRALLTERKWTVVGLARMLGRRRETVWRWLRGRTPITRVAADRIRELANSNWNGACDD